MDGIRDAICIVKFTTVLFTAFLFQTESVSMFPNILGNQMGTKWRIQDEDHTCMN